MARYKLYGVIKYVLVLVNFIFWAVGAAAVGLAIWMLADQTFLVSLSEDRPNFYAGLYIFLSVGILMFFVAFLGCCGAYKESQCMLIGYFSLLLIVIVSQIAAGAWLYINNDKLAELIESNIYTTIKTEYGNISQRTQIVDAFQQHLHCCGAHGPDDWAASKFSDRGNSPEILLTVSQGTTFIVPKSCCKNQESVDCEPSRVLHVADKIPPAIFDTGCTNKILDELRKKSNIAIGIIIGISILELIGLIFSLILCYAIGSNDHYKA